MHQVAAKKSKEDVTVHQPPTDNVEKQSDIDIPSLDSDSSTDLHQAKDIKVPNQDWNLKHSSTDLDSYLLYEVKAVVHGGLLHDAAAHLTALKKEFQVFKEDSVANILDGLSGKFPAFN
ncbi:hypothetical protein OUZ56_029633 [Daphnia magna]|uniref:Uncharacterized protein n=1 Tax=Daphnia magna TaxID=35525 RepID=A0ABR0B7D8_9CRUS|nr:hypothetical protein OUZ56_029633 [Daphnia magna]